MQDPQKLSKILAEARTLENEISQFIPSFHSDPSVLNQLSQKISQFIASNQTVSHFDYIENQTTTSDILLGTIIKQFTQIKKLIDLQPYEILFFRPSPRYHLTHGEEEKLKSYLQAIREEFNKLANENLAKEKSSIKSAAPGA